MQQQVGQIVQHVKTLTPTSKQLVQDYAVRMRRRERTIGSPQRHSCLQNRKQDEVYCCSSVVYCCSSVVYCCSSCLSRDGISRVGEMAIAIYKHLVLK